LSGIGSVFQAGSFASEHGSGSKRFRHRAVLSGSDAGYHNEVFARGGRLRSEFHSIQAGAYAMTAGAAADLANDPQVVHISLDHKIKAKLDYTTAATNATAAWQSDSTEPESASR
jgi:hypothetical protein